MKVKKFRLVNNGTNHRVQVKTLLGWKLFTIKRGKEYYAIEETTPAKAINMLKEAMTEQDIWMESNLEISKYESKYGKY